MYLQAAVSLPNRPFLHCSSIPFIIFIATSVFAVLSRNNLVFRGGLLIFSCIFSHHLRDASRRGLWFYGLPTVQVPYTAYILLELLLPLLYRSLINLSAVSFRKSDNSFVV